jgi:ribosomal protein L11 methyltransferase
MSREWAQIACEVPSALVDELSEFLIELTSTGVTIDNLVLDTFSLEPDDDSPIKTVTAYFPLEGTLDERLAEIKTWLAEHGPCIPGFVYREPTVTRIQEEDWSNNWKEHFKPLRIGRRLVVKPTWEDFSPRARDIVLELDPGMAFGTGTHPTTMLCLSVLEKTMSGAEEEIVKPGVEPITVLDVGTGSGILSIAAAKLGAGRVTAVDIDAEAVGVALENCSLNGVSDLVAVSDTPLAMITGAFDIVLANILAEDLARMAPELQERMNPGALLILSGILTEKESMVCAAYDRPELVLQEIAREGDWSCLVYRRSG